MRKILKCPRCDNTSFKKKSNYSHGRGSKPLSIYTCEKCGREYLRHEIDEKSQRGRY